VTLHVIWGDDEQNRADELREIATWLADWPNRESTWSKNLITLGTSTSIAGHSTTLSSRRA
jgi:hypothetical protein